MDQARKLFQTDNSAVAQRDRRNYKTFDAMPLGLQKWWRGRAEIYAKEGKYGLSVEDAKKEAIKFIVDQRDPCLTDTELVMRALATERERCATIAEKYRAGDPICQSVAQAIRLHATIS